MSKCLKCGAPLPQVGECQACVTVVSRPPAAAPSVLERDLQLDRRRERGVEASSDAPVFEALTAPLPRPSVPRTALPPALPPAPRTASPLPPLRTGALPPAPPNLSRTARLPEALAAERPPAALRPPSAAAPRTPPPEPPPFLGGPAGQVPTTPAVPRAMPPASPAPSHRPAEAPTSPPVTRWEDEATLAAMPVNEPGQNELKARPAALWRRLLSFSIDALAIGAVAALYLMVASAIAGLQSSGSAPAGLDGWVVKLRSLESILVPGFFLLVVLAVVYCAVAAFLWDGRTLGRRLLGLQLVDSHGLAPAPARSVVRALLAAVSFCLFLGGFWLALFDRRGQTLHDKLTSTFVVQPS